MCAVLAAHFLLLCADHDVGVIVIDARRVSGKHGGYAERTNAGARVSCAARAAATLPHAYLSLQHTHVQSHLLVIEAHVPCLP